MEYKKVIIIIMSNRIQRIRTMWNKGHKGFVDFNIQAQNVAPFKGGKYKISNRSDITNMDLPVKDIRG